MAKQKGNIYFPDSRYTSWEIPYSEIEKIPGYHNHDFDNTELQKIAEEIKTDFIREVEDKILEMFPPQYGVDYISETVFDDNLIYTSLYDNFKFTYYKDLLEHIRPFRLKRAQALINEAQKKKEFMENEKDKENTQKEINELRKSLGL